MTRPDVAALAAALLLLPEPVYVRRGAATSTTSRGAIFPEPELLSWTPEQRAEAVLAALEAAGWRLTSAPEAIPDAALLPHDYSFTVDDPASAQAVPDIDAYLDSISVMTGVKLRDKWPRSAQVIEAAAVRAALEGLAAEIGMFQQTRGSEYVNNTTAVFDVVYSFIEARLADLT